jgi:hypothetical protein
MKIRYFIGLFLMLLLFWLIKPGVFGVNEDFRVVTIGSNGLTLRSVSPQRRMVNDLKIEPGVPVWVPKGMGWYKSDKLGKLLQQEKKQQLAGDIMFYNFGFVPDVVLFSDDINWLYRGEVIKKWGIIPYLKFWFGRSGMMIKEENVEGDLSPRDLADSRLLREELRLTVYNSGQSDGLASFISRALEWGGFTVVGVENFGNSEEKCLVIYGKATIQSYGLAELKQIFSECRFNESGELGEKEIELYFGDKFSQMLNYQSYVGTF